MFFKPDKAVTPIFMGKAFVDAIFMLLHPRAYIIRLPNIERPVALVCNYINIEHFMNINQSQYDGKSAVYPPFGTLKPSQLRV